MFNLNSESKMAGPGYITLNVIRVLNIIALLTVGVASWVMLVMTVKTSNVWTPLSSPWYQLLTLLLVLLLRRSIALHHELHQHLPDRLRTQSLPLLLCAQLAYAQHRVRLRLPWHVHDSFGFQHPRQLK